MGLTLDTLVKTTDEKPTFEMPFSGKISSDDSILSVDSVTVSVYSANGTGTISPGDAIIVGKSVFVRYNNGDNGVTYLVKVIVTTAKGDTRVNYGLLEIIDPLPLA